MTARALARMLAMQLELPYEVGQARKESHLCGGARSVDGIIKARAVSKPTGHG